MIDYAAAALPRRGRAVARRRVRGRRVRRPRSARQPRHPPAREGHRRRRRAHDRLHRLRHAPRAPGVVDVRQHARLHGRPDRRDDGSRRSRRTRASSSRSSSSCRRAACSTRRRASRCRAGTHHPGADVGEVIAVAMQHVLPDRAVPADLQDRHPHDHRRRRPAHRRVVHRPLGRGLRRLVQRVEGHGRLGRAERELRQPLEGDRRDQRVAVPARAVEPRLPHRLAAARASGAASAARTTRRKCASTPRSTRTSSA